MLARFAHAGAAAERAWIRRMFASVSDHAEYRSLIANYAAEGAVLKARRGRVRNALVHGHPAGFAIVASVREYAEFLSRSALNRGPESYVQGTAPAAALAQQTDEFTAIQESQDAASYWHARPVTRASTEEVREELPQQVPGVAECRRTDFSPQLRTDERPQL